MAEKSPPHKETGDRLEALRRARGFKTAEAFATAFQARGVHSTTYRSHENGHRKLTLAAAKKYAPLLGTTSQYLLFGDSGEAIEESVTRKVPMRALLVRQRAASLVLSRSADMPEGEQYRVDVRETPGLSHLPRFGVEVHDVSIDRLYPAGTVVECVPVEHWPPDVLADGDAVVVEFWRDGLVEIVLRVLRFRGDEIWLWPDSTDPEHQTPRYWRTRARGALEERGAVVPLPPRGESISAPRQHPDGMFVTAVVVGDHRVSPAARRLAERPR